MVDLWVQKSQEWVNATYKSHAGFHPVETDGSTGWETMFALTRALQIELGIAELSDSFGPTTMSRLTSKYGNIAADFTANKNVLTIIQCALWCKGYAGDDLSGSFSPLMAASIASIRSDMGLQPDPVVTPKVFKSLLNMDAYVTVSGGDAAFRSIQQTLNGRYWTRSDFRIMPCDGLFSRDVQQGLMYALQYEIGMADGVANGNFGPGTQQGIKDFGTFSEGARDGSKRLVSLFKAAMFFNGFAPAAFNGDFDSSTSRAVRDFQSFTQLPVTGSANYQSWASLLVSTGDPERPATASDTATPLTSAKAKTVYEAGYRIVGRYLNGSGKGIQPGELGTIFNQGLSVFPIYQEWNDLEELSGRRADPDDPDKGKSPADYAHAFGARQGRAAVLRARQLGFPDGTTIYFPIDADATSDEIEALVIPYYEGVNEGVATSRSTRFLVGNYGPRNVCIKVHEAKLATTAFVSGMSTGWSANLGFRLPVNWAFDQIKEYGIGAGDGALGIDKNVASPRATPVTSVLPTPVIANDINPQFDKTFFWALAEMCHQAEIAAGDHPVVRLHPNDFVLHYLQKPTYWDSKWQVYAPLPESEQREPIRTNIAIARGAYEQSPGSLPSDTGYDLPHFAATARGHISWGLHPGSSEAQVSDLGGWALDLAQCWADYEKERASGKFTAGVATWMRERVGDVHERGGFGRMDLVADVDAYLVARMLKDNPSRSLADAFRELLVNVAADAKWRFSRFAELRFGGSPATARAVVTNLFTSTAAWINLPAGIFIGTRRPGEDSGSPLTDPPKGVLSTEVADVAAGFSEVLFGLASPIALAVSSPTRNALVATPNLNYAGTGTPGAVIEIRGAASNSLQATTDVAANGTWSALSSIPLPVQGPAYTMNIFQSVNGSRLAQTSVTFFRIPPLAVITPTSGSSVTASRVRYAGTGAPGHTIDVRGSASGSLQATAVVDANGQWSASATIDLVAQSQPYLLNVIEKNTLNTETRRAQVSFLRVNSAKVTVTDPSNGATVKTAAPLFSGTGNNGSSIEIRGIYSGGLIARGIVTAGVWSAQFVGDPGTGMELPNGGYTLNVIQKDVSGTENARTQIAFTVAT